MSWSPIVGDSTIEFLENQTRLSEGDRESIAKSTLRILSRCAKPDEVNAKRSVLVVGEVQSGKTLSFTTVITAARDNNYPVLVLLAGTKRNLRDQTFNRLTQDLNISTVGSISQWKLVKNPSIKDLAQCQEILVERANSRIPEKYMKTLVLIVLKNGSGMAKAEKLLKSLASHSGEFPVLVIDDEADQASMNISSAGGNTSETYAALTSLRDTLSNHTLLMYTATPYAPLLIDLVDQLSPDSVVVLNSGSTYLGIPELFEDHSSRFVRNIDAGELAVATNPSPGDAPPKSLRDSLAYFLVAVAIAQERRNPRPISMLIHPATGKEVHKTYRTWVTNILGRWKIQLDDADAAQELYQTTFLLAFKEISETVDLTTVFPDMLISQIHSHVMNLINFWIPQVEVRVVNSASSANDVASTEWGRHSAWIVIGGSKLDRGFTIENLSVTYMPRGTGVGTVDTIQQRGRFFGHKAKYRDLLRGWLNSDTTQAFIEILETERAMRSELTRYDKSGRPLTEWRREFILGAGMQATRRAVISLSHNAFDLSAGIKFSQLELFHPALAASFDATLESLRPWLNSAMPSPLDNRQNPDDRHMVANISLTDALDLLTDWPMTRSDRSQLDIFLVALRYYADTQPQTDAHIYFMDNLSIRNRAVDKHSVDSFPTNKNLWKVENLAQGRNRSGYVGDNKIRSSDAISIQIHSVAPYYKVIGDSDRALAVVIAWPNGFAKTLLVQN